MFIIINMYVWPHEACAASLNLTQQYDTKEYDVICNCNFVY